MPLSSVSEPPVFKRANQAVAEALRNGIINGELAPGETVIEEDIARALGVSRTPVREALLLLAGEQLITISSARGHRATVREMDLVELQQIYVVRERLEGYAASLAADRITDAELSELAASCDRMADIGPGRALDLIAENKVFHSTILTAAGSDRLTFMVGSLLQIPYAYKRRFWESPDCLTVDLRGHHEVLTALRDRDGAAAELAMAAHLRDTGAIALGDFPRGSAKDGH